MSKHNQFVMLISKNDGIENVELKKSRWHLSMEKVEFSELLKYAA